MLFSVFNLIVNNNNIKMYYWYYMLLVVTNLLTLSWTLKIEHIYVGRYNIYINVQYLLINNAVKQTTNRLIIIILI